MFTEEESEKIKLHFNCDNLALELKKLFNNSLWMNDNEITGLMKGPLMRACARYLYREKRRNGAINSVGK